jgi:hypothetical protein
MEKKKTRLIWGISLIVVGVNSLFLNIANIISFELPFVLRIILFVISAIAIPVLIVTSVKLNICKRKD